MFTLTPIEAALLAAGLLVATTMLVAGVLAAFRRSRQVVSAEVTCPMLQRRVGAQLERDEWTRRFTHVVRCAALGGGAARLCNQGCLRAKAPAALIDAA
jgi:hypothetical protein